MQEVTRRKTPHTETQGQAVDEKRIMRNGVDRFFMRIVGFKGTPAYMASSPGNKSDGEIDHALKRKMYNR